jgi:[lysine-biosynthesis-protein LysW]---L-2-aminoadipate ligase
VAIAVPIRRSRRFHLVAGDLSPADAALVAAAGERFGAAGWVRPEQLRTVVRPRDVVLGRLDVRPSLDGIERGLFELQELEESGVATVLNRSGALFACHDKLATAIALEAADVPHPRTACVDSPSQLSRLEPPLVVKPRLGSWGADVARCDTAFGLRRCFREIAKRPWFQQHGALVQALVPPTGRDLRVLVAGGRAVGAIARQAAPGEWRTNVALGATRIPVARPPRDAVELALAAAAAVDVDFAGVDLLPLPAGGWTVLELNAAVEFTGEYSLGGRDAATEAVARLALLADEASAVAAAL